jgi:hypothetical protein
MGWLCETAPDHEGFPVALVERDGCGQPKRPGASNLYRELQYPNDDKTRDDVVCVQAACECGWRSPFLRVRGTYGAGTAGTVDRAIYSPCIVLMDDPDEERLLKLWNEHIAHETARRVRL